MPCILVKIDLARLVEAERREKCIQVVDKGRHKHVEKRAFKSSTRVGTRTSRKGYSNRQQGLAQERREKGIQIVDKGWHKNVEKRVFKSSTRVGTRMSRKGYLNRRQGLAQKRREKSVQVVDKGWRKHVEFDRSSALREAF
ncbi:hypothetical protein K469DRAFT_333282 [Zopfia rhizophila CBS 207.26]|uniref:Uncharacterized protein n=1 Tax=Zopfia rhizophila CBS 207.26 TaxID=1314779 RepID=A0A6A6DFC5_9PEZI|nr:hypothetical protein K469DRAFT_333282 [Zopfia rhizophila CBS 207.26]